MQRVEHVLEPICFPDSRVLILGTMPSPRSRQEMFYYAHPANRFWRVLSCVLGEPFAADVPSRVDMLRRRHIALWDVLQSCLIDGASDSSIRQPVPNDINLLLSGSDIHAVFTTGKTAYKLYNKLCLPRTGMQAVSLPSTSAANASAGLERLIEAYSVINEYLRP